MGIKDLMQLAVRAQASDLHLVVGSQPTVRVHGQLQPLQGSPILDAASTLALISELLRPDQKTKLETERELDFSIAIGGLGRFRGNAYFQRSSMSLALRSITDKIPTVEELNLPKICHEIIMQPISQYKILEHIYEISEHLH